MEAVKALGSLLSFGQLERTNDLTAVVAWSTVIIIVVIVGMQTGFWIAMKNTIMPSGFQAGSGGLPPILQNRQSSVSGFAGTRRMTPNITNAKLLDIANAARKR